MSAISSGNVSYIIPRTAIPNPKVTASLNGTLVWGSEPSLVGFLTICSDTLLHVAAYPWKQSTDSVWGKLNYVITPLTLTHEAVDQREIVHMSCNSACVNYCIADGRLHQSALLVWFRV